MTYLFALLSIPLVYFYILALGSLLAKRRLRTPRSFLKAHRFAIVIAAHNEEAVIAATVKRLRQLDYPSQNLDIHVVGDYCTDATVALAEEAGAIAYDRQSGPRTGKGAALSWVFEKLLQQEKYDAFVVFDADTLVDINFLNVMDAELCNGAHVIQGQHRIANPESGWFAALTEAKFLIDNAVQNLGRVYWGLSAKNMGDSICLRREVLQKSGWGNGLTEDFQLRQKLLLSGVDIHYSPAAVGWGEAPPTWQQAKVQRLRWMQGAKEVSRNFRGQLLLYGMKNRHWGAFDAGLESYLPTFSTLAALGVLAVGAQLAAGNFDFVPALLFFLALTAYPMLGLLLARAPFRCYLALAKGPYFIAWRSLSALRLRLKTQQISWVRTQHGKATS